MRPNNRCRLFFTALKRLGFYLVAFLPVSCSAPATKESGTVTIDTTALSLLAQTPEHTVLSRQDVIRFGDSLPADTILANGYIIPDERRTNKITSRFAGRIEKLYVHFPFQYVKQGEKLMDIYSPDLNTIINEYLFLYKKDSASALTLRSKQKLMLLGLTALQLTAIEKEGKVPASVSLYSPYSGYVIPAMESVPVANTAMENNGTAMNDMSNNTDEPDQGVASPDIREGSYIGTGQTLFSVNDAQQVIALLSISSTNQSSLKTGLPVTITSELMPDQPISSAIELVEPMLQTGQHFLFARVCLPNSRELLKFNSLVTAKIPASASGTWILPSSCVFDLGRRKIVWVRSGKAGSSSVFTPRIVITGNNNGIIAEIISGLQPGEEVAREAGLLVDREGIIITEEQ